jgi:hypothetical protein
METFVETGEIHILVLHPHVPAVSHILFLKEENSSNEPHLVSAYSCI